MDGVYSAYWWREPKGKIHESIYSYVKHLDRRQSYRQQENLINMRMYGDMDLLGLGAYNYLRFDQKAASGVQNRVTLNVIQSMVDTVVSKITKNKPKPTFLTSGGDWTLQRRAAKLTKFVEGQFYSCEFPDKAARAFTSSCIFGTGAIKLYKENGEIKAENVFIDEIRVDDVESYYGKPRQLHQLKHVHKDVLIEMFPKYEGAIELAAQNTMYTEMPKTANKDMVLVVESWHLRSGPNAKDGKHVISIETQTLLDEQYNKDYFPFVFFRWVERPLGFFGQGLAEQLRGIQLEINKILRTIQVSMHLVSVPKIFLEAGSKIVTTHLNNKIGGIIKYAGTPPTEGKLGSIPTELFTHLDRLYSRAYEIAGVSALSATSQKPSGLNSGKALREYNDLETERFMAVAQRYEKAHLDAAKIMIDLAKEIHEETGRYKVKVPGTRFLETIDWSDVNLEDDQYVMQCFPTSALSSTPAGRLQDVQELMQAGFISQEDARKLLNFPDLEQYNNFKNSGVDDIDWMIERIVDGGEYMTPEPYQNLQYGIQKCQEAYLFYKTQGMPEEQLELFRRWIADANDLLKQAEQSQLEAQAQAQALAQPPAATPEQPLPVA